jgi:hypothetical protein
MTAFSIPLMQVMKYSFITLLRVDAVTVEIMTLGIEIYLTNYTFILHHIFLIGIPKDFVIIMVKLQQIHLILFQKSSWIEPQKWSNF